MTYDSESRFFRWRAVLQLAGMSRNCGTHYEQAASHRDGKVVLTDGAGVQMENLTSFGTLADLGIDARSESGCVTDLRLTFENGIAHVYNENAIRNILWSICTTLTDKNGNSAHNFHMLPVHFFRLIQKNTESLCALWRRFGTRDRYEPVWCGWHGKKRQGICGNTWNIFPGNRTVYRSW